ncbi:MAG: hypothetical protein WCC17_03935 [Candidatus Nitrosopolaris sp.]
MASEKEEKGRVSNPFLNPIGLWQNYLTNWIETSRGFYENAIKTNEHWFKAFWDPWLRAVGLERKKTAKVE